MIPRSKIVALSLSAVAMVGIALHEGYRDRAYTPLPGDVSTIGFGTTSGVRPGDTITPDRALVRLLEDAGRFERAVGRCVTAPLHQYEFDAFVSLAYNIGETAFCGSTLVRRANAGEYQAACGEILRWRYFQGKDCARPENRCGGLWQRRQAEHRQCLGQEEGRDYALAY